MPKDAAQKLIAHTGLRATGMASLAFVRYEDSDLGAYNEVAVSLIVRGGVYIHQLPVNQSFTLEAGRTIWGFPKFMAGIDIVEDTEGATCKLVHDGAHVLTLRVGRGWVPMPLPSLPSYSCLDGAVRRTPWKTSGLARARLGGASLELGPHPIAEELRSLGLPKRALMTTTMPSFRARFGPAENV